MQSLIAGLGLLRVNPVGTTDCLQGLPDSLSGEPMSGKEPDKLAVSIFGHGEDDVLDAEVLVPHDAALAFSPGQDCTCLAGEGRLGQGIARETGETVKGLVKIGCKTFFGNTGLREDEGKHAVILAGHCTSQMQAAYFSMPPRDGQFLGCAKGFLETKGHSVDIHAVPP
ncbi:MAG: hypothetical protein BWY77_01933 [bacterium ADurb.Bin431]|nr:MAG: hypothetical protein BWY77_01933 [bacterium ADurb.Bin431]